MSDRNGKVRQNIMFRCYIQADFLSVKIKTNLNFCPYLEALVTKDDTEPETLYEIDGGAVSLCLIRISYKDI